MPLLQIVSSFLSLTMLCLIYLTQSERGEKKESMQKTETKLNLGLTSYDDSVKDSQDRSQSLDNLREPQMRPHRSDENRSSPSITWNLATPRLNPGWRSEGNLLGSQKIHLRNQQISYHSTKGPVKFPKFQGVVSSIDHNPQRERRPVNPEGLIQNNNDESMKVRKITIPHFVEDSRLLKQHLEMEDNEHIIEDMKMERLLKWLREQNHWEKKK